MRGPVRTVALWAVLALLASGCGSPSARLRPSPQERTATAHVPPSVGPDMRAWASRWPASRLHPGMLLHDDGSELLSMGLDGSERVLWRHARVRVTSMAVAPDGREMAYVISTGHPGASPRSTSWLLGADGSVSPVDEVSDDDWIESPIFVRAPTDRQGEVGLYWMRDTTDFDSGRAQFRNQMMTEGVGGATPVVVPARFGESPYRLDAYPGPHGDPRDVPEDQHPHPV